MKIKRMSVFRKCFGILAKDKEWEEIEKYLESGWKNWGKSKQ